ncbi:hypothetical protein CYMTET_13642 [Cymbomonas tetramitiformis]|uniref:PH domain-containing protein n=1 Tax=Cymbomonas tetramitiformis TaxID=36881 RepID=A0AAE0LB68_9CHLO|nr:hypothetical protein CYMTET_13642 [Cymbomonas tetramitiformis]
MFSGGNSNQVLLWSRPNKEGYLWKQGKWQLPLANPWKERWCVLSGNYLFYFQKEKRCCTTSTVETFPKGVIPLKGATIVEKNLTREPQTHEICIHVNRAYANTIVRKNYVLTVAKEHTRKQVGEFKLPETDQQNHKDWLEKLKWATYHVVQLHQLSSSEHAVFNVDSRYHFYHELRSVRSNIERAKKDRPNGVFSGEELPVEVSQALENAKRIFEGMMKFSENLASSTVTAFERAQAKKLCDSPWEQELQVARFTGKLKALSVFTLEEIKEHLKGHERFSECLETTDSMHACGLLLSKVAMS